jgi:hypothetical protein
MFGLFYPYGVILQAIAIVHFLRRRPDTFWLFVIIIGGGLGALVYIAAEMIPDAALLRGTFEVFPRRKRIKQLHAAIVDNPAIGNYEELGDLYLEDGQYARARECFDRVIAARTDSTDAFYRRALAALAMDDTKAAAADLEEVFARDPKYDYQRAAGLLAHTWARLGELEKAEALFADVTRTSTLSETQYNYAALLAERGRAGEARDWAQRILAKKPTMPNYLRRRERPWFRKARALIKRLPAAGLLLVFVAGAAACAAPASARQQVPIEHVLLVTMDGLRWQELFGGLQTDLLTPEAGGVDEEVAGVFRSRFGAGTPEARREKLMPFFWTTIARSGQVFGDASRGSEARLTNGLRFSYPGYNEILTGYADPRITSNDRIPNPNVTVLEWLNRRPSFAGRVAAFASWELLPWIVNEQRSGVRANGEGAPVVDPVTERDRAINEFADDLPPYWGATRHDAPTGFGALAYLRRHRPRVLYVMLGETDEWAHGRRYDLYLDAAWRNDRFVRRLWEAAQSMPEYANRTALVLTTDHGRGDTAKMWTSHGRDVPAAERIWIAVMAPGVPPLGVRANAPSTQSQVAATLAALLGENYAEAEPKAGRPLNLQR